MEGTLVLYSFPAWLFACLRCALCLLSCYFHTKKTIFSDFKGVKWEIWWEWKSDRDRWKVSVKIGVWKMKKVGLCCLYAWVCDVNYICTFGFVSMFLVPTSICLCFHFGFVGLEITSEGCCYLPTKVMTESYNLCLIIQKLPFWDDWWVFFFFLQR